MTANDLRGGIDAAAFGDYARSGLQAIGHAHTNCAKLARCQSISVQEAHGLFECRYCTIGRMQTAWFKARMKHLKVNQEDLGRVLHCDRTVVSRIISGQLPLGLDQVVPLGEALDVSPFEILWRAGMWKDNKPVLIRNAALLNQVEAGQFAEPPTEPPVSGKSVIVEYPRDTIFALVVSGDSMDKIAPEGSIVIIDYTLRDLKDGDLAVFRDRGEATFKRYRRSGLESWLQPESHNPRHVPIFPQENSEIEAIGRVIEIRPEYSHSENAAD